MFVAAGMNAVSWKSTTDVALVLFAIWGVAVGPTALLGINEAAASPGAVRAAVGTSGFDSRGGAFRVRGYLGHALGDDLMRASGGDFNAVAGFWPGSDHIDAVFRDSFEGAP
jgi:hypothetical protein